MSAKILLQWTNISELVLCVVLLAVMLRRQIIREHMFVSAFLFLHALTESISIPLLFFRRDVGVSLNAAWRIYFYTSWTSYTCRSILFVCMVYGVYSMALRPFDPLRKLGMIIFRWVGGIAVILSIGIAVGPHVGGLGWFRAFSGQAQQSVSILTLCLLLFVCFALKPLGINIHSRLFGTCLGLGVLAAANLIESSWVATGTNLYAPVYAVTGLGTSLCIMIWSVYFYLPEPKRRMVLLPTTSPYFLWNKVSEVLNDAPGFVAVSGITPDCFAPGELDGIVAATSHNTPHNTPQLLPIAVNA